MSDRRRVWASMRAAIALVAVASALGRDAADAVHAAEPEHLQLVQTIPLPGVEGRIDHMALDPGGARLFVAALGNGTVEVVDLKVGARTGAITGLREPQGVAFVAETDRLFVAEGGGNRCGVYDGRTLAPLGQTGGLDDADNVRRDAARKEVYVGHGAGALAALDAGTGRRLADVKLAGHPESFQLESAGPRIFVNIPSARQVAVVDRAARAIVAAWKIDAASANFPMTLDEPDRRALIGCRQPAKMLVLNSDSGAVVAEVPIAGDVDDLFFDAARGRVYASGGEGFVSVIQRAGADDWRPLAKIPTAPGARTSFFVPETGRLYVAAPHRGADGARILVFQAPEAPSP